MKRNSIYSILFAIAFFTIGGCSDFLDTKIDRITTPDRIATRYGTLWDFARAFYTPIQYGFTILDNNLFAAASDEAQQTAAISSASYFNKGTINASVNPLSHLYMYYYEGIRAAYFFLDYAKNGEDFLALNRDTSRLSSSQLRIDYERDVMMLNWYRAEAKVAIAYYYSELIKLYGGVPVVTTTMGQDPNRGLIPRSTYGEVVEHIVKLIDDELDNVQPDWLAPRDDGWSISGQSGRFDKTTALAIKARTLLYAASPRNNPDNDIAKWRRAAQATHDLIEFKNYTMPANRNYNAYFLGAGASGHPETIYFVRKPVSNSLEVQNYPIATRGGNSGITPTENLVSAYEYIGPADPSDPYANRDPRLEATIVVNGSTWNNRIIDQSPGGSDDMTRANASRTGYYLKKFMTDNLNLTDGGTAHHLWIMFRYAEVLLNYAEAMNEAYGPDAKPSGFTLTAREALTQVRNSASTSLPAITTTDRGEFRNALKRERQVELAFEDHRYWDLMRWKDAETVLNRPVRGVRVSMVDGVFRYQEINVATRTFLPRNYYMPFTRAEVENSKGTLIQNDGY
jgi:hypothetical protein